MRKRRRNQGDNKSDIRCVDCKQEYQLVVGSSSERCLQCNPKYKKLEEKGLIDRWHRWVYGAGRSSLR